MMFSFSLFEDFYRCGTNLMLKLCVLLSHWENRNTFKAIGLSLGMSRSPRAEVQGHTFLQNTKGWISDKGYPQKGEPISKNLCICYWDHAVFKEIQLRSEREPGVVAFHFFGIVCEKNTREMRVFCYHDNLERPRLAEDTVELTKLGILILDEKNGGLGIG